MQTQIIIDATIEYRAHHDDHTTSSLNVLYYTSHVRISIERIV